VSRRLAGWLAAMAVCAPSLHARAQVPDVVEVSAQYLPDVPLADAKQLEAQVSSYDAALNIPIPLGERTFLIPGAGYHVESVSFANAPADFVPLRAFHSVDFTLLLVQLVPDDWALSLRVAPGRSGPRGGLRGGRW